MPEYRKLKIGDMSFNGQITIVDEDRLCYIVKNENHGAVGHRTISKALLDEFITYIEKHPDANGNEAKSALSGNSNIDKYEYGYNATLVMLAKMVLGYEGVINDNFIEIPSKEPKSTLDNLQQIYYGSPGTGKSHTINKTVCGESVIRTTFHPDSDYSTFVGCYKPTTKTVKMRDMDGHVIKENGEEVTEDRIVYEFVDQAFLQAYIKAWKFYDDKNEEVKNQFLVIEEINRGNCAQIFGDLFQLLDRNASGFSDYPIHADNDMRKQLAKAFNGINISEENKNRINACYKDSKDYVNQVLKGEILLLPDNFYIWATMNTSDQSLFPIDSAFKRRWDWQYMPIAKGREEGKELNWMIEADTNQYDWWSFLTKINEQISSFTNSEDKKLGFFFCKAKDGVISAETFVGKVIFYLWNDVFKDFGFDSTIFNDEDGSTLSFDKFYSTDAYGKVIVNKDKVQRFLDNLEVEFYNDIDVREEIIEELDDEIEEVDSPSDLLEFRKKYWGAFLNFINNSQYSEVFNTSKRRPTNKKYCDFYLGSSELNLAVVYNDDKAEIGYWIKKQYLYDKFVSHKTEFDNECGILKWVKMNTAYKIRKEIIIDGLTQDEQFKLYLEELVKMKDLYNKYIK